jgi:hypothetical protein
MSNQVLSLSGKQALVVVFFPPKWGQVDRFSHFCSTTYKFDERTGNILKGIVGHFHKALLLEELAESIAPDLKKDREELNAKGHTGNKNGARLAAVIETICSELYSSVDCTRQVVAEIYKGFQGVTSKSTRRFFQNAADGILDPKLPPLIREAFEKADWYVELRKLRDAVIHSDVGSCHLDEGSGKISYFNAALRDGDKYLRIEDIFEKISLFQKGVNEFEGKIFHVLNKTLKDDETFQICGFFGGRVYSRFVRPSEAIDFNSGRCDAFNWFEKDGNPRCPFTDQCGAYKKAKELLTT